MALDSKQLLQILRTYEGLPDDERHLYIGRAVEAMARQRGGKGGGTRRSVWRENMVADTLAMARSHWPDKSIEEHHEWLGTFFGMSDRTVRRYLAGHKARSGQQP